MSKNRGLRAPCHRWTPDEDKLLRLNYATLGGPSLAEAIGVSLCSVHQHARFLGLTSGAKGHQWTAAEDFYLRKNYAGVTNPRLSEILGIGAQRIADRAKRLRLRKDTPWTASAENWLTEHYPKTDNHALAARLGVTYEAIHGKARELGLRKDTDHQAEVRSDWGRKLSATNQRYDVDHSYFTEIDTSAKAYWLGWLWADGYVRRKLDGGVDVVLNLSTKDAVIVSRFARALKTNYPIRIRKQPRRKGRPQFYSIYITIGSQQMFRDLISLGVVPRKSTHADKPNLSEQYLPEFVRGVFDGDGSIWLTKKGYPAVEICGTKRFCIWCADHLRSVGVKAYAARKKKKKKVRFKLWKVMVNGNHNCARFATYIYKNATPQDDPISLLERKYEKFAVAGCFTHQCVSGCLVIDELGGFHKGDIVLVKGTWRKRIRSIYSSHGLLAFKRPQVKRGPDTAYPKNCVLLVSANYDHRTGTQRYRNPA